VAAAVVVGSVEADHVSISLLGRMQYPGATDYGHGNWVDSPISIGRAASPFGSEIRPIGYVESSLIAHGTAPMQGFEGALNAWLVFNLDGAEGIRDPSALTSSC
jgi:hypothetical protein